MSSAHVTVSSPPQNHPKAQKGVYHFYGMKGGWGPRAKALASAVYMGKAQNTVLKRALGPTVRVGLGAGGSTPQFSLLVSGTSMMVENSAVRPTLPGPLISGVVILMLTGCQKL